MSDGAVTTAATAARAAQDVAAMTAAAGVCRGEHAIVWVRGPDATSFLDGMVSQSVAATAPGEVRRSLLLSPQGKMRALLWILGGADEVGLVTQHATAGDVAGDLERFRFRVDATIEPETRPVVTLLGPTAEDALQAAEVPRPGAGWLLTPGGLVAAVPFVRSGPPRFVLVGDAAAAIAAGAPEVSTAAYERVRIAVGEPAGNVDFDSATISHELGPVDDAVDFTKGCYLGQELVARIDSRGRVNQTLRGVVSPGAVPLCGALLRAGERDVGVVTSAAPALDGSATVGLALVRHEVADGAAVVALADGASLPATVQALPLQAF